jgi:hypothetical protein
MARQGDMDGMRRLLSSLYSAPGAELRARNIEGARRDPKEEMSRAYKVIDKSLKEIEEMFDSPSAAGASPFDGPIDLKEAVLRGRIQELTQQRDTISFELGLVKEAKRMTEQLMGAKDDIVEDYISRVKELSRQQ